MKAVYSYIAGVIGVILLVIGIVVYVDAENKLIECYERQQEIIVLKNQLSQIIHQAGENYLLTLDEYWLNKYSEAQENYQNLLKLEEQNDNLISQYKQTMDYLPLFVLGGIFFILIGVILLVIEEPKTETTASNEGSCQMQSEAS